MTAPSARQLAELEAAVRVLREAEAKKRGVSPHKPFAKQIEFAKLTEMEGLYGGAAGGGKTDALLAGGVEYVADPEYSALLLRRTYPDLKLPGALIDRSHKWFDGTSAGWHEQDKRWTFPSGAVLQFGYCNTEADLDRYKSAEFHYIGIDELTEWPERWYTFLFSRLRRRAGCQIPLRMRAGTNPDGIGYRWIVDRFGIPEGVEIPGPIRSRPDRVFLPARAEDNPHLDLASYEAALEAMAGGRTSTRWKQLRQGIWIPSLESMVYRATKALNVTEAPPEIPKDFRGWSFLCGLDFGVIDQNAITVLGWRDHDPCVYVLESYRFTGSPSEMADEVAKLAKRYPFTRIVGDIGGLGKGYQDEARKRQHLPIEAAEKHNKVGYIRLLNDDLGRGRVKVVRDKCQQLLEEWRDLPWAENQQKEADGFNNHCADATLYAWRAAYAFVEKPPPPAKTVEEAYREEEQAIEEQSEDEARRLAEGEWWEG
jgi:hypothetical protein